jgi:hypothetical protein
VLNNGWYLNILKLNKQSVQKTQSPVEMVDKKIQLIDKIDQFFHSFWEN